MGKTAAVNGNGVADTKPAKRKNMASNKEVLGAWRWEALGKIRFMRSERLHHRFLYGCIRHDRQLWAGIFLFARIWTASMIR